jgi:nucleoside-diphosphate-sugar epimerase
MPALVLVSGANGFVGFETVYQALSRGYRVRGTVRRQEQIDKLINDPVLAPWKDNFEGVLVPDLEAEHAFHEALKGCDHAIHLATPVKEVRLHKTCGRLVLTFASRRLIMFVTQSTPPSEGHWVS